MHKVVKDNPDFVRDYSSKAVINRNSIAYEQRLKQKKKLEAHSNELNILKDELADLKELVHRLLKDK